LAAFESALTQLSSTAMPAFLRVALLPGYLAATEKRDNEPFTTAADVPQWRRQWTLWRAARRYARTMRR
jgi:phytoene synthase